MRKRCKLRDPRFAWDYARYWVNVPGAQPRKYSTWLADATWDVHLVHPDSAAIKKIYPGLGRPSWTANLGNETANHYDHVHIATDGGGYPTGHETYSIGSMTPTPPD